MNDIFEVKGKVVAITGGGGALCGALAKGLAARGAKLALWDLDEKAAAKAAKGIKGGKALAVKCDVLDKASVAAALERTSKELGPVDVLINGAGGNKQEATTSDELPFHELPSEAMRFVFELNLAGTVLPSQAVAPLMAERGDGVIINISSLNALRPLTKIPAYSAAKAAVSNFTQWLAVHVCREYSKEIRVNAIAPGFFITEQNRYLLMDRETGKPNERGKAVLAHTPMDRFGEPEDLVGTVIWLVSDASRFVTGVVVPVDGGFSAFSGV